MQRQVLQSVPKVLANSATFRLKMHFAIHCKGCSNIPQDYALGFVQNPDLEELANGTVL